MPPDGFQFDKGSLVLESITTKSKTIIGILITLWGCIIELEVYEIIPQEFTTTGKGDWYCYLYKIIDNVLSNTGMVCFVHTE